MSETDFHNMARRWLIGVIMVVIGGVLADKTNLYVISAIFWLLGLSFILASFCKIK